MKILLINQFFWPDGAPTSLLLTDLARHMADQGHQVTVICGRSTYTGTGPSVAPAVCILRTPNLGFAHDKVARLLSYSSFYGFATWHAFRIPRPDLVVTLTTPPLLSLLGTLMKKMRRARHFSWEMDLYPDVAADLKVFRHSSWLVRFVGTVADYARQNCDGIVALGNCMRERLITRGVPPEKIFIAENWADSNLIHPSPALRSDRFTVLYSGNLGLAHDLDTICAAMDQLKDDTQFQFIFVGEGPRRKTLEQFCQTQQIHNVCFFPPRRLDELSQSLGLAISAW